MDVFGSSSSGAASASGTVAQMGGATQQQSQAVLAPALFADMGEPELIAALNGWGSAMHG